MTLFACGLNHNTANLALREKVAFNREKLRQTLPDLARHACLFEVAILSTCNRTEIYCETQSVLNKVTNWFKDYHRLNNHMSDLNLYSYSGQDAVRHVMRVACGLDSMALGEPQIFGQMKQAYCVAKEAGTVGMALGRLFQTTFSVAKRVRTDTQIGFSPVSIAFAAVKLASKIFSHFERNVVLLIGAGDTIELVARHLKKNGIKQFIFANRTRVNGQYLADQYSGIVIGLEEIANYLPKVDIVFAATASNIPLLGKGVVERALKERRHRPIFMVDLAVPRNIEPEVAVLNDVYLYTVDDLQEILSESYKLRKDAAIKAEALIEYYANHFMLWLRAQKNICLVKKYRAHCFSMRDELLSSSHAALLRGESPELIVQRLAMQLTNKLIHKPTIALRRASEVDDKINIEKIMQVLGIDNNI